MTKKHFHSYIIDEFGVITNNKNKIMKPFLDKDGYLRIALCINGKQKKFLIHRLVYSLFVNKLKNNFVIRHVDSNIKNNHYKNLLQGTQRQNIYDKLKNKTWQAGDTHPKVKYPDSLVIQVRKELMQSEKSTLKKISEKFNVSRYFVFDIKRGKRMTRDERIAKARSLL